MSSDKTPLPYPQPENEARTKIMRANRRSDTRPELVLRSALHARGYRYRVDYRLKLTALSVRPDIVFTKSRLAIFVDGCFWHCCPQHGTQPMRNADYWGPKLANNMARDVAVTAALEAAGWRVVRIWEHLSLPEAVASVARLFDTRDATD